MRVVIDGKGISLEDHRGLNLNSSEGDVIDRFITDIGQAVIMP